MTQETELPAVKELLPCPFCGGSDLQFHYGDIDGWIAHVECTDCDEMKGPMSECKYDEQHEAAADAAERWNRRAALTLKDDPCNIGRDGESERLREALEPFSRFAGPVFERNFNNDDPVDTITASDGEQVTLFARDFFAARAAIASYRKRTT
jgi:Lar family restriction alleviation protein